MSTPFSPFLVIAVGTAAIAVLTYLASGDWHVFVTVLLLSVAAAFAEFMVPEIQRWKGK